MLAMMMRGGVKRDRFFLRIRYIYDWEVLGMEEAVGVDGRAYESRETNRLREREEREREKEKEKEKEKDRQRQT